MPVRKMVARSFEFVTMTLNMSTTSGNIERVISATFTTSSGNAWKEMEKNHPETIAMGFTAINTDWIIPGNTS